MCLGLRRHPWHTTTSLLVPTNSRCDAPLSMEPVLHRNGAAGSPKIARTARRASEPEQRGAIACYWYVLRGDKTRIETKSAPEAETTPGQPSSLVTLAQARQNPHPQRMVTLGLRVGDAPPDRWLDTTLREGRSERHTTVPRSVQSSPQGPLNGYQDPATPAVGRRTAPAPRGGNPLAGDFHRRPKMTKSGSRGIGTNSRGSSHAGGPPGLA